MRFGLQWPAAGVKRQRGPATGTAGNQEIGRLYFLYSEFCPIVVKTEAIEKAIALDVPCLFGELTDEFGEDLLLRASGMVMIGYWTRCPNR